MPKIILSQPTKSVPGLRTEPRLVLNPDGDINVLVVALLYGLVMRML